MKRRSRKGFVFFVTLLLIAVAGGALVLHTTAQLERQTSGVAQQAVQRETEPDYARASIPLWLPESRDFAVLGRSYGSMVMVGHTYKPTILLKLRYIPTGVLIEQVQSVDRFHAEPVLTQAQRDAVSKGKRYYYVTEYKGSIRGYLWLGRVRILFMGQGKRSKLPITRLCEQYTVAYKASQKYLATLRPGSVEWYMVRSTCEVQEYPVPDDVRDGAK
jgi:hypothetical protein